MSDKFKRFYHFQGETRERYYVPHHPNQLLKEGEVITVDDSKTAQYHKIAGLTVKVLARYYTRNRGYKNYGVCIEVVKGNIRHPKGKILYLPSNFSGVKHVKIPK